MTRKANEKNRIIQRISLRRAEIELERKRKKEKLRSHSPSAHVHFAPTVRNDQNEQRKRRKRVKFSAPAIFDMFNNFEELKIFFEDVKYSIDLEHRIKLDFTEVQQIGIEALLYLKKMVREHVGYLSIGGHLPKNEKAKNIILASGFLSSGQTGGAIRPDKDILAISSGDSVQTSAAKKVIDFSNGHLGSTFTDPNSRAVYESIVEMMNNTVQHAFEPNGRKGNWWMAAAFDGDSKRVRYAFLDTGLGIPQTLRRKFKEKIKGLIGVRQDNELILSALKGEFRSRTHDLYRGKGLPAIFTHTKNGYIENLMIYSVNGFLDIKREEFVDKRPPFQGTLFTWDFVFGGQLWLS